MGQGNTYTSVLSQVSLYKEYKILRISFNSKLALQAAFHHTRWNFTKGLKCSRSWIEALFSFNKAETLEERGAWKLVLLHIGNEK